MNHHFRNLFAGLGDVLAAFGTAPAYRYPEVGERAADLNHISNDARKVGVDLKEKTKKALREVHGKVYDCAA